MPHFTLAREDGTSLGAVELGRPDWPDGSIIYRGGTSPTCVSSTGSRLHGAGGRVVGRTPP